MPHPSTATGTSSTTLCDGRVSNLRRQLQLERLCIEQEIEQTMRSQTPTTLQDAATLPYGGGSQQTSTPYTD